MIKIGVNGDSFSLFDHSGYILIATRKSSIIFNGPCRIALNSKIRCVSGKLIFGYNCRIGSNTRIICNGGNITIGDNTGIAFDCNVINSSFHYIYDSNDNAYINRSGEICIGDNNWIGNNSTIYQGSVTSDNTIVSQKSLLNKDYTEFGEYNLIGGMPAKVLKKGLKRVFSPKVEVEISSLFSKNNEIQRLCHQEIYDDISDINVEM